MFHVKRFDVIVIGGGHAGTEAAHAAARMGAQVALVTLSTRDLGVMSCNPAMGGLGKGHIIREIDALDGVMGRVSDRAGIQFRLLNRRKGPAVQGPRAQIDRALYRAEMQAEMTGMANLRVLEAEVTDLRVDTGRVTGVVLADGTLLDAGAVILTTGTFLRGTLHIGDRQLRGGRMGDASADRLGDRLRDLGLGVGRLKTGTPPRLDGRSIDWPILDRQEGDAEPVMFSFLNRAPFVRQIACGITHTNARTHEIIRENLSRSALYGGYISSTGPRYCPSVEDKVVRFADKDSHQIFLEPEGLEDHTVYPNGISTSLPEDVQEDYVRSIRGLESVRILQPGYAIEYDYFDPRGLKGSLELTALPGLFLAGQINGTTGYEEAGGQGLVAGVNAVRLVRGEDPWLPSRRDSYIGVMIDDLRANGATEPYRMFTSRAEYRLSLRADNADQRLTETGISLGLVSETRKAAFGAKMAALSAARDQLSARIVTRAEAEDWGLPYAASGERRSLMDYLSIVPDTAAALLAQGEVVEGLDPETLAQLSRDATYEKYAHRQDAAVEMLRRDEDMRIPDDFDYAAISGLSGELGAKLAYVRPQNLAEAGRIEGMTPAALTLILARLRRLARDRGAA